MYPQTYLLLPLKHGWSGQQGKSCRASNLIYPYLLSQSVVAYGSSGPTFCKRLICIFVFNVLFFPWFSGTKTWIWPQNSATVILCLCFFSHHNAVVVGMALLLPGKLFYTSPLFVCTVTASINLFIIVLYCLPGPLWFLLILSQSWIWPPLLSEQEPTFTKRN